MLHGHDVSNWQGIFNWDAVAGSDGFAFAKASEGATFTDPRFTDNWAGMKAKGLLRGAYHFAHPAMNAPQQAEYFCKTVQAAGLDTDDALALDLEVTDGLGPSAVSAWSQVFVSKVQDLTGKNCFVYTDKSMIWSGCCNGLYTRPLWVASITTPGAPGDIKPWSVWSLQQYTQNPYDLNVLNGDANTWKALVNAKPPAPMWVLSRYVTDGTKSLSQWASSVNHLPSTVLRLTCEHSPNDMFTADVAAYVNGVFAGTLDADDPMPVGMALYYMKAA